MRRRQAFTLVELLVAMALIIFMMVILSEAFAVGLDSFRRLKAIGDMNERLRTATVTLRRDLRADHFEGKRRLSDAAAFWNMQGVPREGFFRIHAAGTPAAVTEATAAQDPYGLGSRRRVNQVLHFSIKLRGNERGDFATASVPANSPLLLQARTNFFDQPADARYQEIPNTGTYQSQWAEVAYFLEPNGNFAGSTPLYTLYRSQFVVVADNSQLTSIPNSLLADYAEMSCLPNNNTGNLYFNTPTDLTVVARRAFNPASPTTRAATFLLADVISFDIQISTGSDFTDSSATFDTASSRPVVYHALKITLRVWDVKTRQARQVTIIQDM